MHIDTSNVLQDIPNMLVRTHRSIEILKLQEEIDDLQQKCSELDELIRAKDMLLEAKNQEICKLKDSS